jgi:hypothetical protein
VEKRKPQPTVRPEHRSQPGAPNCCKKLFGKGVSAKQRHAQSERMKGYWQHRRAAGLTGRIKPDESSPAVRNSQRFNSPLRDADLEMASNYGEDKRWGRIEDRAFVATA